MDWVFLSVTVVLFLIGMALILFAVKRIEKGALRNLLLTDSLAEFFLLKSNYMFYLHSKL